MSMTVPIDMMTLNPGYQEPAIIRELGSASAFYPLPSIMPTWVPRVSQNQEDSDGDQGATTPTTITELLVRVIDPRRVASTDVRVIDPRRVASTELVEKAKAMKAVYRAFFARIETLRSDAALDGFSLSKASERDFWAFIKSAPFIKKGNLVLMDNGNLRAAWKNNEGNHIGLQFLGNRSIQYVIFKNRAAGRVSRVAGCDTQKGIERQIRVFDLKPLLHT